MKSQKLAAFYSSLSRLTSIYSPIVGKVISAAEMGDLLGFPLATIKYLSRLTTFICSDSQQKSVLLITLMCHRCRLTQGHSELSQKITHYKDSHKTSAHRWSKVTLFAYKICPLLEI